MLSIPVKFPHAFAVCCGALLALTTPALSHAQTATPTTTTLNLSATSVAKGGVVTFTANVAAQGNVVYPGQVLFCDADAPHCEDVAILGTAQLTPPGSAVVRLRLGIGQHDVKAVFVGTQKFAGIANAPSTSTTKTVTVQSAGTVPTTTTLVSNSAKTGLFSLSGIVATPARPLAGGTVTFRDLTLLGLPLGTVSLTNGTSSLQLSPKSSPGTIADQISNSVSGDFNNDGIPDIALSYYDETFLTILLGKGDGTFTTQPTAPIGHLGGGLVVADFNGDGILDIAAGNHLGCCAVSILLGNGDGTFTQQASVPAGTGSQQLIAVDLNADGIPDLAVVNASTSGTASETVSILLGNGDGSFTQSTTLAPSPGANDGFTLGRPPVLASGDFNSDGIPDLALVVQGGGGGSGLLYIYLGAGDGTFTSTSLSSGTGLWESVVSADFNGDGIADLALYDGFVTVTTLLGDGKGNFNAVAPSYMPNYGYSLTVGDFNGDGIADLALGGEINSMMLFFGKGNGQFDEADSTVPINGFSVESFSVADFNGDGVPDFAANVLLQNSTNVLLSTPMTTASITLPPPSGGTPQIAASYSGDSLYQASASAATAVASVTAIPVFTPAGNAYTFPFKISISDATPGALITYTINAPDGSTKSFRYTGPFEIPADSVPVLGGSVWISATAVAPGYQTSSFGDAFYFVAPPTATTLYIAPGTSVSAGTPVTLSARVTANGISFQGGIVSFCNAAAKRCEDNILGSANLNAGDLASVRLQLQPGTYSIRAFFHAVTKYPPSNPIFPGYGPNFSEPQTLIVRGQSLTTATAAVVTPQIGGYKLMGRVAVFGREPISGTLDFSDAVNGGPAVSLGSTELSPSNTVIGFSVPASAATGLTPVSLAVADFNRDGIEDIATANAGDNSISILRGNGQGSFTLQSKIPLFASPSAIAAGDLNGDGLVDLAVSYKGLSSVEILLGKPDQTFAETVVLATPSDATQIVIADMDGDGFYDIVTANNANSTLSVFYGDGDGTFNDIPNQTTTRRYDTPLPAPPVSIAVADLNGDGLADIVTSNSNGTVSVLLNGRDFQQFSPAYNLPGTFLTSGSGSVVLADFNGDGITDLAVPSLLGISIYLGNGDGTFTFKAPLLVLGLNNMNTADFDGDGIMDIAVTNTIGKQTFNVVYFGNGDGTFSRSTTPTVTTLNAATAIADFNGDGIPDFAAINTSSNTVGTLLGIQVTSGAIQGVQLAPGKNIITAVFSGTTDLGPATGAPLTVTIPVVLK